jgi:LuxR family maltose regulon positive regulatory protein
MTTEPRVGDDRDALVRPRLHEVLTAGLGKEMTLVIAPAGYGKSVLLESWVSTLDVPVAWVALTKHHNDPGALAQSVVVAVGEALAESVEGFDDRLAFVAPSSAPQMMEEWALGLETVGDFVLVIDDLHILLDESATETAQRLVESAPPNVHLYIASRHDPPLAVARLRLAGRLAELRQPDLAFTMNELRTLLALNSINLEHDSTSALHLRTEGWPAAVRLALISMLQSDDSERVVRNLAGTDRIITEYLVEEVLAQMDPDRQRFLLRTSILDEVTPEIAHILTGRVDGAVILNELVAAGEFTRRRSTGGFWYHRLLRDMLRSRLRDVDPELYVDLHRQAARWWWQQGDSVQAINHAISGHEIEQASAWLGEASRALASSGRAATVVELSGRLLDRSVEPSRLLLLTRMWSLYNIMSKPIEVDQLLERLMTSLENDDSREQPKQFVHGGDPRGFVDASALPWLRGLQARARGDLDAIIALDRPENLPSPSGRVEGFVGEGYLWIERYDDADPLFTTFLEHANHDQYAPSMVHSTGSLAFALIGRGRFVEADPLIAHTSELMSRFGITNMVNSQYAQLAEGWLQWERGDLLSSDSVLSTAQEFADESGDIPIAIQHAILRSRTRWSLGDREGARSLLDRSTEPAMGRVVRGYFADRLALARATLDLLEGEPLAAERWIPNWRERLASGNEREREHLVLARMAAAMGETEILGDGTSTIWEATNALQRIEVAKVRSALALSAGLEDRAHTELTTAMREALACGAIQRVVDEAHIFETIYVGAAEASGFVSGNTKASDLQTAGDRGGSTPDWYVERLTDRELEVLELFSTQLTYPEIADLLYISNNTVKSHAKAIFRKLAVSRRTDAVNSARQFGLIRTSA